MTALREPMTFSALVSLKSSVKRSSAAMSTLFKEFDRVLGTVEPGQACVPLLARRHGAVAKDFPVTFVVVAEKLRDEVVAAAVPLAALGVDLHFHCGVPIWAVLP